MAHVDGDAAAPPLVSCQLTLAAATCRPGDTVTALLQVSCSQPEAVELQEVEIEFAGIERVDTSWVQPSYRRTTPPINADKRKVQRYVVQSRLQAATQGTFSDLSLRRFVVRFTLPSWLPPTFRGTAVRYIYFLQAAVKHHAAPSASSSAPGAPAAAAGPKLGSGSVASRVAVHVWPAKAHQLESATLEHSLSVLASPGGAAAAAALPAADGSLLSPPVQSEGMPIKCWEIGPGTAVQDAVAHIVKLAAQPPAPSRPHSPGRLPRGNSGGKGAAPGGWDAAGSAGDEKGSEISHDQAEEAEAEPGRSSLAAAASTTEAGAPSAAGPQAAPAQGAQEPLPQPPPGQAPVQPQQAAGVSSSASSPRTRPAPSRRPSLTRPSLEASGSAAAPRSPAQLPLDSGCTLRSYALRIGDQPLVRVSLHPPLEGGLHPGSTLAGTLDFMQHTSAAAAAAAAAAQDRGSSAAAAPGPRCMQVVVLLETEEVVEQPWRRQVQGGGSGAIRCVHDELLELTADTACTGFLFTIPPDAPPSFQTPLVQLRWVLRFQFTASAPQQGGGMSSSAVRSPLQAPLEQLSWVLPITVLPPTS